MLKAIGYQLVGVLAAIAIAVFKLPTVWVVLVALAIWVVLFVDPFMPTVESIPRGFSEKQFSTGKVTLNYVEGPDNGPPLVFIPGQVEFWQGYKLVMPHFAKRYHVFAVDLRGHGKSTRTPGDYSYVRCGEDMKTFLAEVVREPAIVSGLSSGAVIALWLAANAPESVAAAVSEDPPYFSSLWPRIADERYMHYLFETMVEFLGRPERDVRGYFRKQGIPKPGRKELMLIPRWIADFIVSDFYLNRRLRPGHQYDVPGAPFSGRVGFKFLCEYDVDFSKATIDGRLSEGFDPEATLRAIRCPVLLIHASWSRHETWGLLGAMDDEDAGRIRSLVKDQTYERVKSIHDVHLAKPKVFISVVDRFLAGLRWPEA